MDKRQDNNAASTQAETSGSSAQDRYCAKGPGAGAKKLGIELVLCDLYFTRFDLTKDLLFDTCLIAVSDKLCRCDYGVCEFESFSIPTNR